MSASARLRRVLGRSLGSLSIFYLPSPPGGQRIFYGPGPLHFGDLRLPEGKGPHPVVVFIHGGFWRARYNLDYASHLCDALARDGVATWNIEYRRLGDEGGGWPGTFEDVAGAVDYLRVLAPLHNLSLDRVVVMGHSAGGHLAAWVAVRRATTPSLRTQQPPLPVRAVVPIAGVLDLRRAWDLRLSGGVVAELLGGSPQERPARYDLASPIERLPLGVTQRLIHGTDDEDVPFEISRRYARAAEAAGDDVTLHALEGAGHFEPVDPWSRAWGAVRETVRELIGTR